MVAPRYHAGAIMRHLRRLGHSLAAGALAGGVLAALQLILWPEIPVSPGRALLAFVLWSTWGALWLGGLSYVIVEASTLLTPGIAVQRSLSVPLWCWLSFGNLVLAALVVWWNRTLTRDYLLAAEREALTTAGQVTAVVSVLLAVVAISTRLRRRVGRWSLAIAALAPLGAWLAWADVPARASAPTGAPVVRTRPAHRLLLVTWEGADLPWLLPAIDAGDMPFLRAQRDAGAWGQLRTLRPHSRQAGLATIATGCAPTTHGVLGRRAYRVGWLSDQPVSLLVRGPWSSPNQLPWWWWQRAAVPSYRRAPLWEILEQAGMRTGLAGWPAGVRASWSLPMPLAAEAPAFADLDGDLRAAVEPALARRPERASATRTAFTVSAQLVSEVALRHAGDPVESLVLNTDLPARLRPLWTPGNGGDGQEEVLRQAVRLLDRQLADLWSLVGGDDTLLVVASPYGMAPPDPWRRLLRQAGGGEARPVTAADSPDGFVLFSGPGVAPATRLRGARLADVTATTLYLLGQPVARDMAGRVLLEGVDDNLETSRPLRLVPSYPPSAGPHS
jgi:hypothetical protein